MASRQDGTPGASLIVCELRVNITKLAAWFAVAAVLRSRGERCDAAAAATEASDGKRHTSARRSGQLKSVATLAESGAIILAPCNSARASVSGCTHTVPSRETSARLRSPE